jgi:hypothetical protein
MELVSATQKKTLLRADYYATLTKRFKGSTFFASSFDADWPVKPLVLRYDDPDKPQGALAVVAPYVLDDAS